MRFLFSISFSLIVLMQSFGISINDMIRLDDLLDHAQYHNEQFGDDLITFLEKHYGELKVTHQKEHQEEKPDHERLPFQHQSHTCCSVHFVITLQQEDLKIYEFQEFKTHKFFYQEPSSSIHLEGLLQPPRFS